MQSKVRIYAKALHEALKGVSLSEQKKRIQAFKGILKKRDFTCLQIRTQDT